MPRVKGPRTTACKPGALATPAAAAPAPALQVAARYPSLPLFANLRCGLWYVAPPVPDTCYFKSTDGHNNNVGAGRGRVCAMAEPARGLQRHV